jgi:hypothetical protein
MNPAFSAAAAFELGKWEEGRVEREKLLKRANSTRASKTCTSKQFEQCRESTEMYVLGGTGVGGRSHVARRQGRREATCAEKFLWL